MSTKNRRSGFTLPEVLVTVTVVAVLAAVVVPAVAQFANKGDAPATNQDISSVRSAVTSYVADTRRYPTDFYDLESANGVTNWKGPYFAGQLAGSTAAGTFTSAALSFVLGPTFSQSPSGHTGYLTTTVTLPSTATCDDLYKLDKYVDSDATADSTAAATIAGGGSLQFVDGGSATCATNSTNGAASATGEVVTLRVASIGS